jgi:hypothetical protein
LLSDINDCLLRNSPSIAAGFQFSDSVFLLADTARDATHNLSALIEVVREMQRTAFRHNVAFRGAFAYGNGIRFGPKGFYGEPIVRAARFEEQMASPLIVIPECEILRSKTFFYLPLSIVRTKSGKRRVHVVRCHRYLFTRVAADRAADALARGPDSVAAAWLEAIETTNKLAAEADEPL